MISQAVLGTNDNRLPDSGAYAGCWRLRVSVDNDYRGYLGNVSCGVSIISNVWVHVLVTGTERACSTHLRRARWPELPLKPRYMAVSSVTWEVNFVSSGRKSHTASVGDVIGHVRRLARFPESLLPGRLREPGLDVRFDSEVNSGWKFPASDALRREEPIDGIGCLWYG